MNYWLVKSEPSCYSIDDFKKDKKTAWTGIRNYQARNFLRDSMKVGDMVFFYHSSTDPMAIVGLGKVVSKPHADETALNKKDDHFDPKATKENPIWYCVDLSFVKKFKTPVTLSQIKFRSELSGMMLVQQGSRLSVQPVSKLEFDTVMKLAGE